MRIDKLTTKFQEALADAQSLAVTGDNPYIEPSHLLAAMLAQTDGPKSLLQRAGVNTAKLQQALEGFLAEKPVVTALITVSGLIAFGIGVWLVLKYDLLGRVKELVGLG